MTLNTYQKLAEVQSRLKAPKNQFNKFGGYSYRSCEDILEALKPILHDCGATLVISDEIVQIGERYYVKATANFINCENGEKINNSAYAREEESKKGMDGSQVTGASSSYARKYALNGLFDIDDTKDSDATNTHGKAEPKNDTPKKDTPKKASAYQVKRLKKDLSEERLNKMLEFYGIEIIEDLPMTEAEKIIKKLDEEKK